MGTPNIEVGPQSLREAATGSREMAGELRGVDPTVADQLKQAMKESGAALNAHRVSSYWEKKLKRLSQALEDRAGKLVAAADEYDSGERTTSTDFDSVMRGPEARYPRGRYPGN